ncbi:MAG: hypothetical protein HRU39_03105 [Salinicola sp.]|uniref:hypothetical protein n=1 Tax=Salinicola sp. TaxID=1978524 RepID=UPI001E136E64|nr:hypothetical protein [Salinicola sp.]NRB54958.1 hypothetical protein [Salinicola sp.]
MNRLPSFDSHKRLATLAIAVALGGGVPSALAADPDTASAQTERPRVLSGDEIQQQVWGHRVQGAMAGGQQYDEVYRQDGRIEGDGYTGQATIVDDRMCFDYGDDKPTCYGVRHDGDDSIEWLDGDVVVGEGELGNAE